MASLLHHLRLMAFLFRLLMLYQQHLILQEHIQFPLELLKWQLLRLEEEVMVLEEA
jgi:hypothetical protein